MASFDLKYNKGGNNPALLKLSSRGVGLLIEDGLPAALLIPPDVHVLLYNAGAESKALPAIHLHRNQLHRLKGIIIRG